MKKFSAERRAQLSPEGRKAIDDIEQRAKKSNRISRTLAAITLTLAAGGAIGSIAAKSDATAYIAGAAAASTAAGAGIEQGFARRRFHGIEENYQRGRQGNPFIVTTVSYKEDQMFVNNGEIDNDTLGLAVTAGSATCLGAGGFVLSVSGHLNMAAQRTYEFTHGQTDGRGIPPVLVVIGGIASAVGVAGLEYGLSKEASAVQQRVANIDQGGLREV